MTNQWNLDALYESFDAQSLHNDLAAINIILEKYSTIIQSSPIDTIERFLTHMIEDMTRLRRLGAFGHLHFSTDSRSQKALSLTHKVQKATAELTEPVVAFKTWLSTQNNLTQLAEESSLIKEHLFYLTELKNATHHMLSPKEEILAAKLKMTGSSAWETLQSKVSSQLTGEIVLQDKVEVLPIMTIRNMAYSNDPQLRKSAYVSELSAYEKHAEISASALNGIKGEVLTMSALRGFDSPLDESLYNARMDRDILNALIQSMEDRLPVFQRYLNAKAKALKLKGALPFYDMFAPIGNTDKDFSIEEAKSFIVKHFGSFSAELSTFAQKCFDQEWVDFQPRDGKVGGAFCSNIPSIKESRVLLNFTGKLKNVLTIAHELGHAFHGDRIMSESILNTNYPMPLAETASIFCETIVRNAVLKTADDALKLSILENSLMGATGVVVDILSRFYFESEIFEIRKDHPLSVSEFKDIMLKSQKKAYGNALDHDNLHPFMWLNKTHYYYSNRNFYNFPYAFGLLFAKGLYSLYEKEGSGFTVKYDDLLKATGKMSIEGVCLSVGINPKDKAFWNESLDQIERDVEVFEALVSKMI